MGSTFSDQHTQNICNDTDRYFVLQHTLPPLFSYLLLSLLQPQPKTKISVCWPQLPASRRPTWKCWTASELMLDIPPPHQLLPDTRPTPTSPPPTLSTLQPAVAAVSMYVWAGAGNWSSSIGVHHQQSRETFSMPLPHIGDGEP